MLSRVSTQFVNNIFRRRKDIGKVCLQRCESSQREIAATCPHFNNRPMLWGAKIEVQLGEVLREGRSEYGTRFGRCAVISFTPLPNFSWPAVVTITLVIERRLHPVMKRHWTSAFNSFAQSISQGRCARIVAREHLLILCEPAVKPQAAESLFSWFAIEQLRRAIGHARGRINLGSLRPLPPLTGWIRSSRRRWQS